MNNEIYVGQDPLINFGEKNTFGGELRTGKTFGIKFSNATAADVNVAICPADFHKLTDIQKKFAGVKAILKSGEIANIAGNKFMAASLDPNNSIDEFMKWIKSNPSRITDLYIESDKAEFFATTIYQKDVEPYSDKGDKRVVLSEYIKSGDYNQERKHIPLWKKDRDLYFHENNVVTMTFPAKSEIVIRFSIGAELSMTKMFEILCEVGRDNARKIGGFEQ